MNMSTWQVKKHCPHNNVEQANITFLLLDEALEKQTKTIEKHWEKQVEILKPLEPKITIYEKNYQRKNAKF